MWRTSIAARYFCASRVRYISIPEQAARITELERVCVKQVGLSTSLSLPPGCVWAVIRMHFNHIRHHKQTSYRDFIYS